MHCLRYTCTSNSHTLAMPRCITEFNLLANRAHSPPSIIAFHDDSKALNNQCVLSRDVLYHHTVTQSPGRCVSCPTRLDQSAGEVQFPSETPRSLEACCQNVDCRYRIQLSINSRLLQPRLEAEFNSRHMHVHSVKLSFQPLHSSCDKPSLI